MLSMPADPLKLGDYRNALRSLGAATYLTGSRTLPNYKQAKDWDFLVEGPAITIGAYLHEQGFEAEGNESYAGQERAFTSWRKGDINFLVTSDPDFAARHRLATALMVRFNLQKKEDRVALFKAVLYGEG